MSPLHPEITPLYWRASKSLTTDGPKLDANPRGVRIKPVPVDAGHCPQSFNPDKDIGRPLCHPNFTHPEYETDWEVLTGHALSPVRGPSGIRGKAAEGLKS